MKKYRSRIVYLHAVGNSRKWWYLVVVVGNVLVELVLAVDYQLTQVHYLATRVNCCIHLYTAAATVVASLTVVVHRQATRAAEFCTKFA